MSSVNMWVWGRVGMNKKKTVNKGKPWIPLKEGSEQEKQKSNSGNP